MFLICGAREDCWGSLDNKAMKPVNPKGNQPWICIWRTDAEVEAEAPVLWPHDSKSWLTGKDPDAGKDWGKEKKRETKEEMVGWHYQLNALNSSKLWKILKDGEAWPAAIHGVTKSQTWQWLNNNNNILEILILRIGQWARHNRASDL